jgi:hypothetical protein
MALIEIDGAPIDDYRPPRMIGDKTVVLEADRTGFSRPRKVLGIFLAGPA